MTAINMPGGNILQVLRNDPGVIVARVTQDIRTSNADEFEEDFMALAGGGATTLVLDFRSVRYMDSTSIGVLLKCSDFTSRKNVNCLLFGMAGRLRQVISVSGLDRVLSFLTPEDAVQYPELTEEA